jgi:hypothetical protein
MDVSQAADTFTLMLHAIDARNWDGVRQAFADRIDMDYSSLFGVPAATISGDDQVAEWRAFAGAFDATQHITGPIITIQNPDGNVTAHTHVRGYHRITGAPGGEIWMVAGHYDVRLVKIDTWKIAGIRLTVFYQEGNLSIPELARSRAASATKEDAR